jgi:hypothetical protein
VKKTLISLICLSLLGCDHFPVRTDIKVSYPRSQYGQVKGNLVGKDWKAESCLELKKSASENTLQYSILLTITDDVRKFDCYSKIFGSEKIFALLFETPKMDQGYEVWKFGSQLSSHISSAEREVANAIYGK